MKIATYRRGLLATTFIAGAFVTSTSAFAQTDPGQGATPTAPVVGGSSTSAAPVSDNGTDATGNAAAADQGEVVVTGSRISNPNLTSTSPLTIVSAAEVKLQGTTRVEDLVNSLPQVFASQGSTDSNGATGIATVDLRDLGSIRTLVLVNGRRLVPGDPTSPSADLNFIPASLIQRVDILTGGASSIYGSDAVAGVVNFILNKDFEGVQLDAQYSLYNHDNDSNDNIRNALRARNFTFPDGQTNGGAQRVATLTIGAGTEDGRGHVTAYASYRSASPVTAADRDFSACQLTAANTPASTFACGGSSTAATGRFQQTSLVGFAAGQPIYAPSSGSFTVTGNNFRPYLATDAFNFNPYNYFQRNDQRYTFGTFAHYKVSDGFDPYVEAMFMDDRTNAVIAPSGAFYGTDFFVNCNNPFLSAGQSTALCGANAGTGTLQSVYIGRRNVEGGGRNDDLRHTDYRIVVGARGDISKDITYDAYGQLGRAILTERYANDFSRARLNRALNVVRNGAGTPVCASALPNAQGQVLDANCVPYNIFQAGGVTPAALTYLQTPGFKNGSTTEWVASGSISAKLGNYGLQSPLASNGVGLAIGAEYRKESLELRNDIEFLTGDLAGQGTPFGVNDASGSFNVKEFFGEINIPLIEDRPFFQSLAIGGAYRRSDYSIQGKTDTYKLDAEWSPVRDIRFRGTYNRAVRAPNILELFTPATVQLFSTDTDPCAGPATGGLVNGNTFAQCARTGVTQAQFGNIDPSPAGQYNQRTAGNAALTPETSDSYTAGVVLQPSFIPKFVLTVDAYRIKVKNLISTFGADFTLGQCLQTGNPLFCNRINRATGSGSLFVGNSFVDNPNQNLGNATTQGIDVNASYRTDIGKFGNLGFDLVGTYLDKFKTQPLPNAIDPRSYDCAGHFGLTCGTPLPKWRSKLRVTWNTPYDVQISGSWRYFNHITNDQNVANDLLGAPGTIVSIDRRIPAVSYFDLAFSTRVSDKYTFRIGSQNILDKMPPIRSF